MWRERRRILVNRSPSVHDERENACNDCVLRIGTAGFDAPACEAGGAEKPRGSSMEISDLPCYRAPNYPKRDIPCGCFAPPRTVAKGLTFSREYDVRRGRRRHMLGARIAQRRQVDPRKERLTTAEQDRRDRDMHLVDEPRLEILAHRGRPAADLDIAPARGLPGATERFLNSAGDEMKDGPAFHRDRFARVVRQHEHRYVIRRVLAPPAAPLVVGPRPAYGAEHVSAHDIRTDAFPEALGKIVVGTRRPARFAVYLAKRARADVPAVQLLTTHAEWVLQSLAGAGAVPVERDREVVDAHFGHGILRWFHMRRMGRPEIDRRRMSWGPDSAIPGPYFKAMRGQRGDCVLRLASSLSGQSRSRIHLRRATRRDPRCEDGYQAHECGSAGERRSIRRADSVQHR